MQMQHIVAMMTIDRDAKRQYIVITPNESSTMRIVQRAWSEQAAEGHQNDDDDEESLSSSTSVVSTSTTAVVKKRGDTFDFKMSVLY